jgi:pyruvate/2-oxoglutarate dehydrogenase complex dihydrolipoamide acyltransferase (E2) component
VTGVYDFDVTDTVRRLDEQRAGGRRISLTAVLVKATALLMERHPRMNHHVFRRWFRHVEVEFDHVSCTLAVQRAGPDGEEILFPVLIRDANRLSLEEIFEIIRHHKQEDLAKLPQIAAFERIKRMSWLALKYFSYKARSDPAFYEKYFGSYGLSSLVAGGAGGVALTALANTGSAFLPAALRDKPWAADGRVVVRRILTIAIVADHYLLDGMDIVRGMQDLREMLEKPVLLESAGLEPHTQAAARP